MRLRGLALVPLTVTALLAGCATDGGTTSSTTAAGAGSATQGRTGASSAAPSSSAAPGIATGARCDAETTFLDKLNQRQKLGQLLMVGVTGRTDAVNAVQKYQVGGIFIGSWTNQGILQDGMLADISHKADVPLMISIDEEGGRVSRLPNADLPSARELAASKTPEQVRAEGKRVGGLLKQAGITVDFAPDADVSDESADAVIGDRSYSNDPQTVIEYSQAFAAGLREAGIMPVFKHFPGHGHGSGDSHVTGVTTPPLAQLAGDDLLPFWAAAKSDPNTTGIMVGHLTVPGLTEPGLPASLSPSAMHLLRTGTGRSSGKKFGPGWDGVIFTDDLSGMGAISNQYSVPQAVVKAISAGADMALWISTDAVGATLDALAAAVKDGRITPAAVDASVLRIARAKGAVHC